jgi:protocatechuate 3,4-dioxygenase beta subunit
MMANNTAPNKQHPNKQLPSNQLPNNELGAGIDAASARDGFSRRHVLVLGGVSLAAAAVGVASRSGLAQASTVTKKVAKQPVKAKKKPSVATTKSTTSVVAASSPGEGALGGLLPENGCVLTPEITEGPFYLDINKVRADITEGRPGTPLALSLKVVSAATCKPIAEAAVDIWHTDAAGAYSGVQGVAGIFMRGTQRSDANGLVEFKTVYPGWYNGRTVHIHVMVHVGGNIVHTGQLFFDDAITDEAYKAAPYNKRGARDRRNASDGIYQNGGLASTLKPAPSGSGFKAALTMGVQA